MKKLTALLLTVIMLIVPFVIASCGEETPTTAATTAANTEAVTTEATTAATDATSGDVTADVTTAATEATTAGGSSTAEATTAATTAATEATTAATEATTSGTPTTNEGYEKPEGYENVDFGGHTFKFLTTEDWSDGTGGFNTLKEIYVDDRNGGSVVDTAVYDRNFVMKQLYNCNIYAEGSEDCGKLISADVLSGTNEYDFGSKQYLWYASSQNGYYTNVYSLNLDFDLPGWSESYFKYTTVRDSNGIKHNYMIDGEFNLMTYKTTWAIFVNLDMYNSNKEKWGGDDIFTLVQEGRWTIDKMMEICSAVAQDDGDQVWTATKEDQKDIFGLMTTAHNAYGLMTAVGYRTFENNDGYLSSSVDIITANDAANALKKAGALSTMEGVYVGSYAVNHVAWNGGKALFMGEVLNHFEAIKDVEGMFGYTVVPEPLYVESDHPEYHSYVNNKGSLYLISKNACGGDTEMVANFLNLFVYHSHYLVYPAFLEAYGKIYCDDERSAEMLDTIVNGIVYDLGYYKNNPAWGNVAQMVNDNNVKLSRAANTLVSSINDEITRLVANMDKSE